MDFGSILNYTQGEALLKRLSQYKITGFEIKVTDKLRGIKESTVCIKLENGSILYFGYHCSRYSSTSIKAHTVYNNGKFVGDGKSLIWSCKQFPPSLIECWDEKKKDFLKKKEKDLDNFIWRV